MRSSRRSELLGFLHDHCYIVNLYVPKILKLHFKICIDDNFDIGKGTGRIEAFDTYLAEKSSAYKMGGTVLYRLSKLCNYF